MSSRPRMLPAWPAARSGSLLCALLCSGSPGCGDGWQHRLEDQLLRVDVDMGGGDAPSPWEAPGARPLDPAGARALAALADRAWQAGALPEAAAAAARLLPARPQDPDLLGLLAVLAAAPAPQLVAEEPAPEGIGLGACRHVIGLDGAAARLDADGRLLWSTARGRFVKLPPEPRPGPCELQPSGEDLTVIQGGRRRHYSWPDLDEDEVLYPVLAPEGLDGRRGRLLVLHGDGRWTLDLPGKGRGQAQGRLPAPLRPQAIWLAPTGLAAAVVDDRGGLGVLLLPRGEWTPLPTPATPLQALAWAPDGQRFVTVDAAGRVQVSNRAGEPAGPAWTLTGGPVDGLLWPTHDQIRIALAGRLVVWERAEDRRADLPLPEGAERVRPCSKGSLVALQGGELAWLDPDGAPRWRAQPGLGRLSGLSCDLDGAQVAAWTEDGRLALLDADTGRLRLRTPALGPLRRPVRRRDGHLWAVGEEGRAVDLWVGVLTAAPDGLAARLGSARGLYAQPEGVLLGPPWPSPPALR